MCSPDGNVNIGLWPLLRGSGDYLALGKAGSQRAVFMTHGLFPGFGYELSLARALGDRCVYVLTQWLREQTGQPQVSTVEELGDVYAACIRELQPSGPYTLVGYSASGISAFEIARRLVAVGETVELSIIDAPCEGRPSPSLFSGNDIDDMCIAWSRKITESERAAMAELGPDQRLRALIDRLAREFADEDWMKHLHRLARIDIEVARRFVRTFMRHLRAIAGYQFRTYARPIRFFERADQPGRRLSEQWQAFCPQLEVEVMAADHTSMFTQPELLATLVSRLRAGWT